MADSLFRTKLKDGQMTVFDFMVERRVDESTSSLKSVEKERGNNMLIDTNTIFPKSRILWQLGISL